MHCTRDGELVIFHDPRLERTTNGHGLIRDRTLSELEKLDAAYHFSPDGKTHPLRGKGITIPTLASLVDLDPNAKLNLEMKQLDVDLPRALHAFIESRNLNDRVLVAAAEWPLMRDFRRLARGRIPTGASRREVLAFWLAARARCTAVLPIGYQALQVPPRAGRLTVIDENFVRAAHARSLHVHAWTIDDAAEMRELVALGVDGLMSDRPDLLLAILRPA